ncbi:MAG: YdbL family protein [Pseudomonadota bacterium]
MQPSTLRQTPLFACFAALFVALLLLAGQAALAPAEAQSLKSQLASGAVGERYDGYLEARNSSARSLVNSVNAKRRELYEKRAQEVGQSAEVVGKVYAKELYQRAASGTWFLTAGNTWTQKP